MKCLCFLLLVAVSQAFVTRVKRGSEEIPTPIITRLMAIDPPGFIASWTPVSNKDSSDPILGYKVFVWEQSKTNKHHFIRFDTIKSLVLESDPIQVPNYPKIPKATPKEFDIPGADNTSIRVEHIKIGVTYEVRVKAYTKTRDGGMSEPMRIQIMPSSEDQAKNIYTVE